jgi:lipid A 3-O-deacylase
LSAACAGPEVVLENDSLGLGRGSDGKYSNGMRLLFAMPRDEAPEWARKVANGAFFWSSSPSEALVLSVGHHIYTPEDTEATEVVEDDRPYAAWLYGGVAAYNARWDEDAEEARDKQTVLELVTGLVGPHAYGEELQDLAHEVLGFDEIQGWDNQLEDELTLMLAFEVQHRVWRNMGERWGADAITHLGGSAGTPYTMAGAGADLRFGFGLPRDFGVSINEPALVTTAAVRGKEKERSLYFFTGVRGRLVGWSTFLDGNLIHDSHSVERIPLVADLDAGIAWLHGRWRLTYAFVYRTDEFEDEPGNGHVFGSIGISWTAN